MRLRSARSRDGPHGVHRALGKPAAARRPTARPTTAESNRSGIRRSAPIPAACHRRSTRADTIRRPMAVRARCASRAASPRYRSARAVVAARFAERREAVSTECRKKPSHVLSPRPAGADAVHAVVPVAAAEQRQAVRARRSMPLSIARMQCSKSVPPVGRHARLPVGLVHVWREQRRLEERHAARRERRRRRSCDIIGDDVGQPEQIVGAARPQPAAARLVPPVLDVAFDELAAGGPEQMCALARSGRASSSAMTSCS